MSPVGVYDQIKKAFQDLIAPELHAIRGDIRLLDQKIDFVDQRLSAKIEELDARLSRQITELDARLSEKIEHGDALLSQKIAGLGDALSALDDRLVTKIDSLRGELLSEIRRLDVRIDGVETRLGSLEHQVRTAIDIRERLAVLEARSRP